MPTPVSSYGDSGVYRRGLRIVDRTFPRTHKPVKSNFGMTGSLKDIRKMAISGLKSSTIGLPGNHPYASMAFLMKMIGSTPNEPDRKARQLGFKDAKDQDLQIKNAMNRKGQLSIR